MLTVHNDLDRFALPPEILRDVGKFGGFDLFLVALQLRESVGDFEFLEEEMWHWALGNEHMHNVSREDRDRIIVRMNQIVDTLAPIFKKAEITSRHERVQISDDTIFEVQKAIYMLSSLFQKYEYHRIIDSNGTSASLQPVAHLVRTVQHNQVGCIYIDVATPIFNTLFPDKEPIDTNELKLYFLLHDLGRLVSQHSIIHERLEKVLFEALGVPWWILRYGFEAEERFTSADVSRRSVTEILETEHYKAFVGLVDVAAKHQHEDEQDELRTVDAELLQVELAARAAHYFLNDQTIEGVGYEYVRKVLAALENGTPEQQAAGSRYGNEIEYYGQLINWLNERLAEMSDGKISLNVIREAINQSIHAVLTFQTIILTQEGFPDESERARVMELLFQHVPMFRLHSPPN